MVSRSETILFNEVPLAKSFWSKIANRRCFEVLERNSKRLNFIHALIRDFSVYFYLQLIGNLSMLLNFFHRSEAGNRYHESS